LAKLKERILVEVELLEVETNNEGLKGDPLPRTLKISGKL
jgi:hypothetical protein